MLKFDCAFTTDVGKRRNNNEDNFYFNHNYKRAVDEPNYESSGVVHGNCVFAVCDGMGGEEYGEKAALMAVETLNEYDGKNFNEVYSEYVEAANEKVCKLIEENNGVRSGTTLALLYINGNEAVSYNIGDSRVYLMRDKLAQISEEHTRVAQMVRMGILTKVQAATHRDKHVLTQHLGIFPDEMLIQVHKSQAVELQNNDIFLLCSDGLTDMLTDDEIEEILKQKSSAKECADALKNEALAKGGKDNVTVGIIKVMQSDGGFFGRLLRKLNKTG